MIRADRLAALPLARATQLALGASIVLFVCGSSSVQELHRIGSPFRWLGLFAFAGSAVTWAVAERGDISRLLPVAWPALAIAVVGVASAVWSIDSRLTIERSGTFAVALAGAIAVGAAVRGRLDAAQLVAEPIVGAASLICVAGGVLYAFDPGEAAQLPVRQIPLRFSGIGENPNTVQMLAALAVILALWLAVRATGLRRLLAGAAVVILGAHVAASGSRGGLLAVVVGTFCFALGAVGLRRRLALLAAAAAISGGVAAGNQLMYRTMSPAPQPAPTAKAGVSGARVHYPKEILPPLDSEVGVASAANRSLLSGEGRGAALREAFHQGSARPFAGFGFGTEEHAFFDRLEEFESARPENSFLGFYLQLGVVGPLLWAAVGIAVIWLALWRARSLAADARVAAAAWAGVVAAGFALGLGQSYVYAVGNVATLAFWVSALVAVAIAGRPRARPSRRALAVVVSCTLAPIAVLAVVGRWEGSRAEARQNAGLARIWTAVGGLQGREADGFRLSPPEACVLYASGGEPAAYELCFQGGHLVEAYDRRHGSFHVSSLRAFGPTAAAISVSAAAVDARIHSVAPDAAALPLGPAYLTRPIPG
jgi:hypothetical protein